MDQIVTLFFNGSSSLYLDAFAWNATNMLVWFPFIAVIIYVLFREHNFSHFMFILGATIVCIVICDQMASSICKPLVARWRPTHQPEIMHLTDIVSGYRGGFYGFFSSHAANTWSVALFLSLVFRHRNTTLALIAWSLLNCWTRLYLGVHYLGDIVTGIAFGSLVGLIAFRIYRHYFSDATTFHYHQQRIQIIPISFVLTLFLLGIPWKLVY